MVWFPRATTWDFVAAATGAETVYFSDLPPGDWPCPDLSHLDWDQAADFTEALVEGLRRRGILDRFRSNRGIGAGIGLAQTISDAAEDAISTVRQLRPGSIETELQEAAVRQYEIHRSKNPCAEKTPPLLTRSLE